MESNNWQLIKINHFMELQIMANRSSLGISINQLIDIQEIWRSCTESGKQFLKNWASKNDIKLKGVSNW